MVGAAWPSMDSAALMLATAWIASEDAVCAERAEQGPRDQRPGGRVEAQIWAGRRIRWHRTA